MSFGNAYVKSTVGHCLHQHIHGTPCRHGGSDADDAWILFGKFHQGFAENVLIQRWQVVCIRCKAFTRFGIELSRCMPNARSLLGRFEAFPLNGVQVQDFRSFHIFDVPQDTCDVLHIVSVDGAEVADIHSFEDILLLGSY